MGDKRKPNGAAEPETIYAEGAGVDDEVATALDQVAAGGPIVTLGGRRVVPAQAPAILEEAAVMHQDRDREVLFCHRPRRPWEAACVFAPKTVGSVTFRVGRPYRTAVTMRHVAALEAAYGRMKMLNYVDENSARELAEHVEVIEPVCAALLLESGSRLLYVRRRLWWPVGGPISRFAARPAPAPEELEAERRRGRNYPDTTMV